MIKDFVGLHNHSAFSFQDGIATPEELVVAAKDRGLNALAITEHGHCHSHAQFHFACKKHSFKGIFGVEAYVINSISEWSTLRDKLRSERAARKNKVETDDSDIDIESASEQDKNARRILNRKGHLVLLAKNDKGLSNIYQIVHRAHRDGFYQKPRADKDILRELSGDIVASSACMGGVISNKCWQLQRNECDWAEVVKEAEEFDDIFKRGNFFLELQFNEHENQKFINECMIRLHKETGIPLSVTTDAHYVKDDDWQTQQLLHMLLSHRGKRPITMNSLPENYDFKVKSLYVKSAEQMYEAYLRWNPELPRELVDQAFANVLDINSMISDYNPNTSPRLPTLKYESPLKEVAERAIESLKLRGLADDERYTQRLLYEVKVIKDKGIAPYFLVVKQIVERAKKEMLIGPGRGSAAGSLLCYLLGITNIDPIEHKLMFERFINVDRMELPDIDLDFEDVDRVKDVLREMFGSDNVACISAYGTNQIKGLLKDVCRVYDIDHTEVNKANALIERELKALYNEGETRSTVTIKMEDVYRLSPTFRGLLEKYPQIEQPVNRLYGRPHHVSRHASGVVIGDNLPAETAVFYSGAAGQKTLQTSFTDGIVNKDLSNMGLVKFDILSLATLSVIRKTCEIVSKNTGRDINDVMDEIDPKKIDFNDQHVMKTVFWEGNLTGIFQSSQQGMRRLLQQVKPETFEDVAATCALYRPGPLGSGMDQMYARRKNGLEDVSYDHPILESILKDTYGCLIYQEQMLEIGRQLGNMSWKDVNRLRKLFLKKDKSKQDDFVKKEEVELKEKLVAGVMSHGMTEKQGNDLWDMCGKFGGYGFNVAHAKSYGMVTMQTAYLRTYYPVEFLAAVLAVGQTGEVQEDIDDIRRQGFNVLPVDINLSMDDYRVEGNAIRLSLSVVKGIGKSAVEKIMSNRPYTSFSDFLYRSGATKTSIMPLIKVGAFYSLVNEFGDNIDDGVHRQALLDTYDVFTEAKGNTKRGRQDFELIRDELISKIDKVKPISPIEMSAWESEFLSFNVLYSPFSMNGRSEKVKMFADAGAISTYDEFVESDELVTRMPVIIKEWREKIQKNGQMMGFLKFGMKDGREFEAPAFSGIWKFASKILSKGDLYIVTFNKKEEDPQRMIIGKPGWFHSREDCIKYFIRIDDLEI